MSNAAAIQRLLQHFGNNIDKDVLESVLAICENNVDQAITFLTAQEGDVVVNPNAPSDGLPDDYPGKIKSNVVPAKVPEKVEDTEEELRIVHLKKLFFQESSIKEHFDAQTNCFPEYCATLVKLLHHRVEVAKGSRARILASCWHLKEIALPNFLLENHEELFGLPEVLRAITLLDAPRKIRALEKKIALLEKKKMSPKNNCTS